MIQYKSINLQKCLKDPVHKKYVYPCSAYAFQPTLTHVRVCVYVRICVSVFYLLNVQKCNFS